MTTVSKTIIKGSCYAYGYQWIRVSRWVVPSGLPRWMRDEAVKKKKKGMVASSVVPRYMLLQLWNGVLVHTDVLHALRSVINPVKSFVLNGGKAQLPFFRLFCLFFLFL